MSLSIEGSYCDDLQSVVQLSQQWSAVNGKSKNLAVAQSHEASCLSWSPGSNICSGKLSANNRIMNLPSSIVLI